MRKLHLAIASLALAAGCAETETAAQPTQSETDARYDRALAAGYKALFLCSGIANSERAGQGRTAEQIHEWELSGIYPGLDPIIRELEYAIVRDAAGTVDHVSVDWSEDAAPRIATHTLDKGCSVQPIGTLPDPRSAEQAQAFEPPIWSWSIRTGSAVRAQLEGALGTAYGEGRTTATIVFQGGELVDWQFAEGYSPYTPQRTWSVAKSIAGTVVGAAVHRGEADVNASAGLGVDESDPRRAITIDDGLRMATGRYSDTPGNRTDPLYWGGTTVDERADNWPMLHEPGTVFRYANNDTLAAVEAIEDTFAENPPSALFTKLGMNHTIAETDWQGNYVLSSQVWASALDLARFGQLHAQDGVWEGERILPEGWVEYISDPSGPQRSETNWGYGAGWWTFHRNDGLGYDGIPEDAFAAQGNRGQYVVVVPSRNVVIVRRGEDQVGTRFDIVAFTRDVLEALEE